MKISAVITWTKLVMKLKFVSLESGSSPLSNDAISVSIRCIVWKIFAFKTTPLKNDTFQPDENELNRSAWKSQFFLKSPKNRIISQRFKAIYRPRVGLVVHLFQYILLKNLFHIYDYRSIHIICVHYSYLELFCKRLQLY
jgi:hypothetical protein